METDRLRQFCAVVDAGGLVRAADILGISAGGLSKSLKVLEHELGVELFSPRGRGLELSEAGRRLYHSAPPVIDAVEGLRLGAGAARREAPLRLVSFEVFTTYFLADVIARRFVGQGIELREALPGAIEAQVAAGTSDIGITYTPVPTAGCDFSRVAYARMAIYGVAAAWRQTPFERLPFVVPVTPLIGMPSGAHGLDGWPDHLLRRQTLFRVQLMETAIQLCQRGAAVIFLPTFVATLVNQRAGADLRLDELSQPAGLPLVRRTIFLVRRTGAEEGKLLRILAQELRRIR